MQDLVPVPVDDLGTPVPVAGVPERVVSLVPNLTEALWWWGRAPALVGVTQWCVSPEHGLEHTARVRGTKNPDVAAVVDLAPDLVVANVDENRELDVRRLRDAGVTVHVTAATDVQGAAASLERLGRVVGAQGPAAATAEALRTAAVRHAAPVDAPRIAVAVPIWRDPWMTVGTGTVVGDVLATSGFQLVPDRPRYPAADLAELDAADLVLLPDEPYAFGGEDRQELLARVPGRPVRLVDGQDLTWWGPRTPGVLAELAALRRHVTRRRARARRR